MGSKKENRKKPKLKQTKVLEFGKILRIKKSIFDKGRGRERERDRETTYGLKVGVFPSRN